MKIINIMKKYSEGKRLELSEARHLLTVEKDSVAFYWLLETSGRKPTGCFWWDKILAVVKIAGY